MTDSINKIISYVLLSFVGACGRRYTNERVNIYSILYFIDGCAIAVKVKKSELNVAEIELKQPNKTRRHGKCY